MRKRMLAKVACLVLTGALVVSGLGSPLHAYGQNGDGSVSNGEDLGNIDSVGSLDSAAYVLYSGMIERKEKISFRMLKSIINGDEASYAEQIMSRALVWPNALVENDGGKGADYLKWSRKGYSIVRTPVEEGAGVLFEYTVRYHTTAAQEVELDGKITEIVNSLNLEGKSDYEKAKTIYDWVCTNVKGADSSYANRYSAYGAVVDRKAVCEGYMTLFYRLCYAAGIKARCVQNKAKDHGWNLVFISESKSRAASAWYNVDCTQGAQSSEASREMYFLKSDKDLLMANNTKYVRSDDNEYKDLPECPDSYDVGGSGLNLTPVWSKYEAIGQNPVPFEQCESRGGRLWRIGETGDSSYTVQYDRSGRKRVYVFLQSTCPRSLNLANDLNSSIGNFADADIYLISTAAKTGVPVTVTGNSDITGFKGKMNGPVSDKLNFMHGGQALQNDWFNYTLAPAKISFEGKNTPIVVYMSGDGKIQHVTFDATSADAVRKNLDTYCSGNSSENPPAPTENYVITYELDGGTNHASNPVSYSSGSTYILEAATKVGYAFKGWYEDTGFTKKITALSGKKGNLTLYAKFEKKPVITYHLDGGTNHADNQADFMKGENTIILKDPTKAGYAFKGWYLDAAFTQSLEGGKLVTSIDTGDVDVWAKWSKEQAIDYVLNGGTNHADNPSTHSTGDNFALKAPAKIDNTFVGWYTDENLTQEIKNLSELKETAAARVTLYAKWEPNPTDPAGFPGIDMTLTEGNVLIGITGSYETETADTILKELNRIRLEACKEGVYNPVTNTPLKETDYVPLKWSSDMEAIARFRAAEVALRLDSDHTRPSGKKWNTVKTTKGRISQGENLALYGSLMAGIKGWYDEKPYWVDSRDGDKAGHYTNLINPTYKYVAVSAFRLPDTSNYPLVITQEFSMLDGIDEAKSSKVGTTIQDVEVAGSAITSLTSGVMSPLSLKAGTTYQSELSATVKFANTEFKVPRVCTGPVRKGAQWTSSDAAVATVSEDGLITAVKNGTATITAKVGDVSAAITVEVADEGLPSIKDENGKTGWDAIIAEGNNAEKGSVVKVDMNGTAVVPGNVIKSLRGKDVTVTFDMGNVTWSINGQNVTSGDVGNIDLSVKTGTQAIPENMVKEIAKNDYSLQLSLAHEGTFGFTAELSVPLGTDKAGMAASLYYYNMKGTGKLEPMSKAKIEQDGTAKFAFTHASDYVIVASKENSDNPAAPAEKPFIKGDSGKAGWESIISEVSQPGKSGVIKIDMNGVTIVPGSVFANLKGKDVTLLFDMGNATWSVNGKSVTADNIGDIDFAVKFGPNAIPESLVKEIAGNNYSLQFSLAHKGQFGFTAELSVNLETKRAGYTAKLYYYNPNTRKLELSGKTAVEKDGAAKFIFTHASDYVIVASKEAYSTEAKAPKTGDPWSPWWIALAGSALSAAGVSVCSKRRRTGR